MTEKSNLRTWSLVRTVPNEAKKSIVGGRLKGFTDINPVWRLKILTEIYGPCGIGWRYEITKKEMVDGTEGQTATFVDVLLYVKEDNEWSFGIPGTGGSMFVAKETSGLRTSDEAYKMALTDALSVSCKALGIGADVYWEKDPNKYDGVADISQGNKLTEKIQGNITSATELEALYKLASDKGFDRATVDTNCKAKFRIPIASVDKSQYKTMFDGYSKLKSIYADTPFANEGE